MSIHVRSSVGVGGTNHLDDVRAVQRQLNGQMSPPRAFLTVDGKSGKKTARTIRDFQRSVLGFKRPDGRVDPGGKTQRALNDVASEGKWARMSMMPPAQDEAEAEAAPAKGDGLLLTTEAFQAKLTVAERAALEKLLLQFRPSLPDPVRIGGLKLLDDVAKESLVYIKRILATQGVVQYAVEVAEGLINLHRAGFTGKEIAYLLKNAVTSRSFSVDKLIGIARQFRANHMLKRVLSPLSTWAGRLGIVIAVYDSLPHFRKADLGPGFAELYAGLMAYSVPWAGAVNAAMSLLTDIQPSMKNPHVYAAFDVIKALDPINAGKTAVDLQWTYLEYQIAFIASGKFPQHVVQKYVDRIEASPAQFWNDGGKFWQDFLTSLSESDQSMLKSLGIKILTGGVGGLATAAVR